MAKTKKPILTVTLRDTDYRDDLGSWQKLLDSLMLNHSTRRVELSLNNYSDKLDQPQAGKPLSEIL